LLKPFVENLANISIGRARNIFALRNLQRVSTSIRMTRGWILAFTFNRIEEGLQLSFASRVRPSCSPKGTLLAHLH
jgi:hypothetical protein